MKLLQELFDGLTAAELETFQEEPTPALPAGISVEKIKDRVRQKTGVTKKRLLFPWKQLAPIAACLCVILLCWNVFHKPPTAEVDIPTTPNETDPFSSPDNGPANTDSPVVSEGEPSEYVRINSTEDVARMRQMLSCSSEEEWQQYSASLVGTISPTKSKLADFLAVLDCLPVFEIGDAAITSITWYPDSEEMNIVIHLNDRDWLRLTYFPNHIDDLDVYIEEKTAAGIFDPSLTEALIPSADDRIQVYSQTQKPHVSGVGDYITWHMVVDDTLILVNYYVSDADTVSLQALLDHTSIFYFGSE